MNIKENQHHTLSSLKTILRQESHVLTENPSLIWQQLHNRLNWGLEHRGEDSEIKSLLKQVPPFPWIQSKIPPSESPALVKILQSNSGALNGCAFDRTGCQILSVGSDGTIRIWDMDSNTPIIEIETPNTLYCCEWSDNGELFAAGSRNGDIYIYQNGHSSGLTLSGHEDYVYCCSFSPNGKYLLSGSGDQSIRLWDLITGQEIKKYIGHTSGILQCEFSRDGSSFISSGNDKSVIKWDLETGTVIQKFTEEFLPIQAISISPDNKFLITCGADRVISLRDFETLKIIHQIKVPQKVINACGFTPDGQYFTYAGDNDLIIGDVTSMEIVATLTGHSKQIKDIAISPNGKFGLSASQDNTLRIWQLNLNHEGDKISLPPQSKSLFFTPGKNIVTSSDQGTLLFWDTHSATPIKRLPTHESGITDFSFDLTGKILATCGWDKTIKLWNSDNDQNVAIVDSWGGAAIKANVLLTKGRLAFLGRDNHVRLIDVQSKRLAGEFEADQYCVSSDESTLAFSFSGIISNYNLNLVDTVHCKPVTTLSGHKSSITDYKFTNQGDRLVSASNDKTVRVWDLKSFQTISTFTEHQDDVKVIAISPNDEYVLSLDGLGIMILWRLRDGEIIHRFHTNLSTYGECLFSPDGSLIIIGGDSNWVKVIRIADGKQVAAIPTFASVKSIQAHPFLPEITYVDKTGNPYLLRLENITYNPIILTAFELSGTYSYICPSCRESHIVRPVELGQVVICANSACKLPINLNPFSIKAAINEPKKPKGMFRRR